MLSVFLWYPAFHHHCDCHPFFSSWYLLCRMACGAPPFVGDGLIFPRLKAKEHRFLQFWTDQCNLATQASRFYGCSGSAAFYRNTDPPSFRLSEHFRLCILRPSNLGLFRFPFQHAARSGGGGVGWIKCGTFWSAPPDLRMRSRMCTLMNSIIQFGSYLCVHCKWRGKWRSLCYRWRNRWGKLWRICRKWVSMSYV